MTLPTPPSQPHGDIAKAIFAMVEETREARLQTHRDLTLSIDQLNITTAEIGGLMKSLEVALTGDELGNPGIVHRQNDLQGQVDADRGDARKAVERIHTRIDDLEAKLNRIVWFAVGIGVGSGVGTASLIKALGLL